MDFAKSLRQRSRAPQQQSTRTTISDTQSPVRAGTIQHSTHHQNIIQRTSKEFMRTSLWKMLLSTTTQFLRTKKRFLKRFRTHSPDMSTLSCKPPSSLSSTQRGSSHRTRGTTTSCTTRRETFPAVIWYKPKLPKLF